MTLLLLILFGLYFILMLLLLAGWSKASASRTRGHGSAKVTVVVPFRNEAAIIGTLIEDLSKLHYPAAALEVILVNDHSTDASEEKVLSLISGKPNFRLLSLPAGKAGKKRAITHAVDSAQGDIVVTTDADCRVPAAWIAIINACFVDGFLKMVIGGVRIEGAGFLSRMQSLEFSSLIGVSAATAELGFPAMGNGANLAFLKSAFLEVNGYEGNFNVASGDDEFLLRKIDRRFPGGVHFLYDPDAVVATSPQKTVRDFISQRLRWAAKWKFNTSLPARLLAVFVLIFQASFLLLLILLSLQRLEPRIAIPLIAAKLILEFFFLFRVCSFLQVKWKTLHFLILQFVYPVYVIVIGLASLFLPHEWKGRTNSTADA